MNKQVNASPRIEIRCHQVLWGITPKARLLEFEGVGKQWLPKNLVEFTRDPGQNLMGDIPGTVSMPQWLARKLGIIKSESYGQSVKANG